MTGKEFHNVHNCIEQEGFDYCFRSYSHFEEVQDEKFHELREAYIKAANDLLQYIGFED